MYTYSIAIGKLNAVTFQQRWIMVDVEGADPATGRLREFGAVHYSSGCWFHGHNDEIEVMEKFRNWVNTITGSDGAVFWSDNPAYDWQCINARFAQNGIPNPFGHSARRIGDFYAGLCGNVRETQRWKRLRITPHDHNPVNDARGNAEALGRLLKGEL